ncbi:alpha/beta hydrolase [Pedobacter foliorum]|uniref:alpha/beta hydrolase n=1 Tax=Pedobacter foliorum TaxID=2739058 RepID=UPI001565CD9C|nr:alpha/beta hydrolase [Pedobacter foliorum]NRF40415.1 alpha/beta hydrolase [Pedobacter foliorum]
MNFKKSMLLLLLSASSLFCSAQDYIFFLHNKFAEDHPLTEEHPEYGKTQYLEILSKFKQAGFRVISEKRAPNTDVGAYSKKVVLQIDSLLKLGVKSDHITVIGTSKGGYIAQYVSSTLKNPNLNFVFIGCYRDKDLIAFPGINFCGNILTIYERSDEYGVSAVRRKETSNLKISNFKEIELNTGLKHGFLFKPMKEWINPSIQWARRNYK